MGGVLELGTTDAVFSLVMFTLSEQIVEMRIKHP
jgi:hypothetical protein